MTIKLSETDWLAEVERITAGRDPEITEDDPADFDPPAPIPEADAREAEAIVKRHETQT